ncbi:DUF4405 domain-containing protein [Clostridium sp. KNHs205]|uniref:DUF4405 domain-containing protein n=1 Tax=Clostridium sp. KNHs205 TaxID=1449050 RepID=UPI001FA73485|nr:DUF4405 domain-containing protein [Clostridium sp. KNHs205]
MAYRADRSECQCCFARAANAHLYKFYPITHEKEAVCIRPKMMIKIAVDIGMTVLLLLLMTYELIGQAAHEWIGIGMFVLFAVHHILNSSWSRNVLKGKYTALRILQTALVAGVLLTMLGSMVSGIILSRHALSFLPIEGGRSWARNLHMVSAYGGFVLMSLHLGFHWNMMMAMAKKHMKKSSHSYKWLLRGIAVFIAGYGVCAFIKREIGSYMLLKIEFVYFDFDEPLLLFILDYMAAMGLFVFVGHYLSEGIKRIQQKKRQPE